MVGDKCPVASYFGFNGIGEGIVWNLFYKNELLSFKSKDERHSNGSKIKILKPIDNEKENRKNTISKKVTPVWRLDQIFNETFDILNNGEISRNKISQFIQNVIKDILKEDNDILISEGFELNDIIRNIQNICRSYYFEREKEFLN